MTELCLYIITIRNNMKTFLKNLLVRARELQPYIQYTRRTAHTPAHKIEVQIYYVSWFWRLYMFDSLAELIRLRCTRATASCTADMARDAPTIKGAEYTTILNSIIGGWASTHLPLIRSALACICRSIQSAWRS